MHRSKVEGVAGQLARMTAPPYPRVQPMCPAGLVRAATLAARVVGAAGRQTIQLLKATVPALRAAVARVMNQQRRDRQTGSESIGGAWWA